MCRQSVPHGTNIGGVDDGNNDDNAVETRLIASLQQHNNLPNNGNDITESNYLQIIGGGEDGGSRCESTHQSCGASKRYSIRMAL